MMRTNRFHDASAIGQQGSALVQSALAILLLSVAIAAGISISIDWARQSSAELQAQQLLKVQTALQRFIVVYQQALLTQASDPNMPLVDANADSTPETISLAGNALNLNTADSGSNTLTRTLPSMTGITYAYDFTDQVLQKGFVKWLKPAVYASHDSVADLPVQIRLSIDSTAARIRGLACLGAPLLRDGAVDVRALQNIQSYRAPDGSANGAIVVSTDGKLRSNTGFIDPAAMRVALPTSLQSASVPTEFKPGTVCVTVGDWPATLIAGVGKPNRVTSDHLAQTGQLCAHPGEIRWIWKGTTPASASAVQGLQRCGTDYRWQLPVENGAACNSGNGAYSDWGRGPGSLQPVHLSCFSDSKWQLTTAVKVAAVGDACTLATGALVERQAVSAFGITLYCEANFLTATPTLLFTPGRALSVCNYQVGTTVFTDTGCVGTYDANALTYYKITWFTITPYDGASNVWDTADPDALDDRADLNGHGAAGTIDGFGKSCATIGTIVIAREQYDASNLGDLFSGMAICQYRDFYDSVTNTTITSKRLLITHIGNHTF